MITIVKNQVRKFTLSSLSSFIPEVSTSITIATIGAVATIVGVGMEINSLATTGAAATILFACLADMKGGKK